MFANEFGQHKNVCCGLVQLIKREEDWQPPKQFPIPLVSVSVNASVVHAVAQVEVTQVYVNKEEQPIEAIYYFPVNPDGAVTHFQAELEGKVIKGVIKKQEEAKEIYDKAVENKTTAFLGEETKADIFKVRVGFLKPGAQVKVIIGYVTEVKNEPGTNAIRFYIPTTIAPRYVSPSETDDKAQDIKQMKFSESSPAPLSVKVAVSLQGGIKSVESPTHKVKVENTGPIDNNQAWHKSLVQLEGETTDMDRDFVLNILPEEIHKPRLYTEKLEDGSTAAMVHLVPSFKLDEQKTELIFVLDRSGSMMGQSIDLAKKALLLFLHSMPADCYFNVIGFGSTFQFLFPNSVKYDDKSLKEAISHAKTLGADLGGTEILQPLKAIYEKPCIEGYLRQIFVLTDGEVSNTDGVLGIAQANAHKARVFALGIGDGASHYLVEGIAKAGGGTSAFVTYNESIDKKVLNQLKNGLQPSLTDIELEWEGLSQPMQVEKPPTPVVNTEKTLLGYGKPVESESEDVAVAKNDNKQSPKRIPPVYDGSQLLVFGIFQNDCPKAVTIKAGSPDGPLTIKVNHSSENDVGSTKMLHRLAAVKLVRELELDIAALYFQGASDVSNEEKKLKDEVISISCKEGVTSKYTSFVAVDSSDEKPSSENWVMETRSVPSQFAHGWHGGATFGYAAPMMACMASAPVFKGTKLRAKRCAAPVPNSFSFGSQPQQEMQMAPGVVAFGSSNQQPALFGAARGGRGTASQTMASFSFDPTSQIQMPRGLARLGDDDDEMECETEEVTESSPVEQLIELQSFDGSYTLSEKFGKFFGKTLDVLKKGASDNKLDESVFATALAIAYFSTKLLAEKDVWDLVVMKARKWLAKAVQADQVDATIELAKSFV